MRTRKFYSSAVSTLTALLVVWGTVAAADTIQTDGDVLSGGLNIAITDCSIAHSYAGEAVISYGGSSHFANGANVSVAVTPASGAAAAGITASGGSVTLPNPWNSGKTSKRSISVSVPSGIANGTYKVDTGASGAKAGGGSLSLSDFFNINVSCPTNTAPTLALPADITAEAGNADGAAVSYSVSASDTQDGDLSSSVSCAPASGTLFSLGSTPVNCSVTDSGGLTANGSFQVIVLDTTAPVLALGDVVAEAAGPNGANVDYNASASDAVDGNISPDCSPASGSTFALGATTVNCSATDMNGNSANGSFTVTVQDTTAPDLSIPFEIIVEATGASGAAVSYSASASDLVDGVVAVNCSPVSGSTFALGTTHVDCSATDAAGNTASGSFAITIQDTTPPSLSLPGDITQEATGPDGAAVSYGASASDLVDGAVSVDCSPASGSTFGLGTSTVQCSATDARGNSAQGSFAVTVQDTTGPALALPSGISVYAASNSQAVASYVVSASDLVDGARPVSCSPASGSMFGIGTTTVNCSASDSRGNASSGNFTVTVAYQWNGFFQPVDNKDPNGNYILNKAKAGSTVPAKFSLGGDQGLNVLASGYPTSGPVSCGAGAAADTIEEYSTATVSGLKYDPVANLYIYNWKTDGKWAGTCRQLVVKLADGAIFRANFSFFK
jgi:hypothetical protein